MAIVKEPKGIDFVVKSEPWTNQELKEFRMLMKNKKSELGEKKRSKRTIKKFPSNRCSFHSLPCDAPNNNLIKPDIPRFSLFKQ